MIHLSSLHSGRPRGPLLIVAGEFGDAQKTWNAEKHPSLHTASLTHPLFLCLAPLSVFIPPCSHLYLFVIRAQEQ